ncbi:hypothetical protein JCGZ_25128 [Jatropha curcas]|uniref:BHLH domain-containing protein n=1 Tax=Jatropha curcas TaxID=180498 RepID=A0A067JYE5_JATCU|nr:transcription factor EMB1444 [Jatropha curcas]KDP24564.1 hypothetical protein JCGZ_25128 [Jatropha curcas]
MGTTALRQLLKSLCNNSVWNYAVLWNLSHGSQRILTWEDGHFNPPNSREVAECITDDAAYYKDAKDIFSRQFERNTSSGSSEEYRVGHVVANMMHLQYAMGEGVVGKVAFSGDPCWVCLNNLFTNRARLIPECPEEWLLQFASGIQTILLVPVLPHRVLQLGSLEEVAEDINIIEYVKDRFNGLHSVSGNGGAFSIKKEFEAQLISPPISSAVGYLNATTAYSSVKTGGLLIPVNNVELNSDNPSIGSQVLPLISIQEAFMPAREDLPEAFKYETENKIVMSPISLTEISTSSMLLDAIQLEMVESKLLELSLEELQAYSDTFGEPFPDIMNSFPASEMTGEPSGGNLPTIMDNIDVSNFLKFPEDCELHKALGQSFRKQTEKLWDTSFMVEDTLTCSKNHSGRTEPSLFTREGDGGNLLEAVVANAYNGSHDTSNRSNSCKSSASFSGDFAASPKPQNQYNTIALVSNGSIPFPSACISEDKNADGTSSTLGKMMNTNSIQEQQQRVCDDRQLQKGNKVKRRARPGDQHRPRPRDRQLIQDRVKELRELVPNSGKCSIDSLLDRTIKHMLYLRNVTDQAEKLKQCVHQELAGCKNWSSSKTKQTNEKGTSWAFELGNEIQMCPILVEDLAFPGHMLIEMLCNENGLFLEIAQVIRGLDLTILKGVLENRSNDTWARFIVGTSKGFHRLDIFWPLMQLLQQRKRNPISSKI